MKNTIKEIFESHELLRLGTIGLDGMPNVRSVDFAHDPEDESTIYFTTFNMTNKVKEIEANNNVYVVIDKPADSIEKLAQIRYIRGKGKAYKVEDGKEIEKAMMNLVTKYPFLPELPGDASQMSVYKIKLSEVFITDNNKGFGTVEVVNY